MSKSTVKKLASLMLAMSCLLVSCAPQVSEQISSSSDDNTPSDTDHGSNITDGSEKDNNSDSEADTDTGSIYDIKKADGSKVKIACIGDSITFGTGITNRNTDSYPAKLQTMLGDGYEVGNFGRGGAYVLPANSPYNLRENKELSYRDTQQYKDSIAFAPDVVVICLGTNDMLGSMVSTKAAEVIQSEYEKIINVYKELDSVVRVYVLSSILATNNCGSNMLSDGPLQELQKRAAQNTGCQFLDAYSLTREFFDTMLHTSDRLHPNDRCTDVLPSAVFSLLTKTEYTTHKAPTATEGVVFVSSSGKLTNDGLTPQTPVNSLPLAAGMLRENGGTIVICGDYTCYKQSGTIMPKTNGVIKVTSVYGGVDYRSKSNARLSMTSTYLYLGGDMLFDDLTINSIASSILVCNYHNVTIGESVKCTVEGSAAYPIILSGKNVPNGGMPESSVSLYGTCNITVNSGTWAYVRNGNRRAAGTSTIGEIAKDAKLTFTLNGGEFKTIGTQNISAATGMNNVHGEVSFLVNGGIFDGNLYVICRIGTNNTSTQPIVDGKVNVRITSGEIKGELIKLQDSVVNVSKANIVIERS